MYSNKIKQIYYFTITQCFHFCVFIREHIWKFEKKSLDYESVID